MWQAIVLTTLMYSVPTAANEVAEGGTIEIITDGASTNAAVLYITFVIRR